MRTVFAIVPLLALLALGGCGRTYTITLEMMPENRATAVVYGPTATVRVLNEGPGDVVVRHSTDDQAVQLAAGAASERGDLGREPYRVTIESGAEAAAVRLRARNATGVSLEQMPMAK